jgi:hypothetical protein
VEFFKILETEMRNQTKNVEKLLANNTARALLLILKNNYKIFATIYGIAKLFSGVSTWPYSAARGRSCVQLIKLEILIFLFICSLK